MNIKKKLKKNPYAVYIRDRMNFRKGKRFAEQYDDYSAICLLFMQKLGAELSLSNPKRFSEKLQWLKLFYREPLIETCSDKYTARKYIEEIHPELLNELLGVYDSMDDIDFNSLPRQFVLKATHGSGWNLICRDKSKINWKAWKRVFNNRLKQNIYVYGREWNYKNLKPRIIVEKYLEDDSGELRDYKIFCMNGTARFMQIDEGRFSNPHRVYVNRSGENMDFYDDKPVLKDLVFGDAQKKMFELAEELSKPFPHVRIDFYLCNGKIYFGEFTFFDGSGFVYYQPDSANELIGNMLILPEPNHNIELLNTILSNK